MKFGVLRNVTIPKNYASLLSYYDTMRAHQVRFALDRLRGVVGQEPILPVFKRLQNEFDVRGVSIKTTDDSDVTFSPVEAFYIAFAFSQWVLSSYPPQDNLDAVRFVVGYDSRLTSPSLGRAVLRGFDATRKGCAVNVGLCSTPSVFYACQPEALSATGGVMVTASHLPYERNGMKFFRRDGGLTASELTEVLALASRLYETSDDKQQHQGEEEGEAPKGNERLHGPFSFSSPSYVTDIYGAHLVRLLRAGLDGARGGSSEDHYRPLAGLKILVNAGNGVGGFFASVLEQCGADTSGSLFLEPDGHFPNHPPNPENAQAMSTTAEAVRAVGADLGIVFDTDVDRVGFIQGGPTVTTLNRNRLIALASAIVLRESPGATIVTDSVSSLGVAKFIAARGGRHVRYKKGYKNVIDKAMELEGEGGQDCALAIECSGHAAFKANRFSDDGCFLAVKLVIELARAKALRAAAAAAGGDNQGGVAPLEELIGDLEEPVESEEVRLVVRPGHDRAEVTGVVLDLFKRCVDSMAPSGWSMEPVNHEGLRATVQEGGGRQGWLHFRASLHDPVISLTIESDTPGGVRNIMQVVDQYMANQTRSLLDWRALEEYT